MDPKRQKRWDAIVRRLKPMNLMTERMIADVWVIATDSVTIGSGDRVCRRTVRLSRYARPIEVVTWRDPSVFVRTYEIPGRPEHLLVLSFIGDPYEGGYETQVPVILGAGTDTLRVEHRRW
jgi:hypothetical protein